MPNVHELIRDHVTLSIRCLDRLYLHAYLPKLQTSGGLCYFLRDHLGHPIPSPALFAPDARPIRRRDQDLRDHAGRAADHVRTGPAQRRRGRRRIARGGRWTDGVVVIGVAQEKMRAFKAHKRSGPQGGVTFDFSRQSVAVNHYYFYVQDPEWGPAFLKLGTYLPYPIKLCLNGHEWVKQQLRRADVAFDSLDNGFLACADPTRLQAICDQLGPADVQAFFDRWTARLPAPLTAAIGPPATRTGSRSSKWRSASRRSLPVPCRAATSSKRSFARIWTSGDPTASASCFRTASRAERRRRPGAIARA